MPSGTGSRTAAAAIAAAAGLAVRSRRSAEEGRAIARPTARTLLELPVAASPSAPSATDADSAARKAARLLELARTTGDTRYLGRAAAEIRPWRERARPPLQVDLVTADLAQLRHAFGEARMRLDRVSPPIRAMSRPASSAPTLRCCRAILARRGRIAWP